MKTKTKQWIGIAMVIGGLDGSLGIGIIIRNYERPPLWAFCLIPFAVWGVMLIGAKDRT